MLELKTDSPVTTDYEQDLAVWYQRQAELLRARRFNELDLANLIEELDVAVGNLRKELANRLEALIMHLLKCQFQRERLCGSWKGMLTEQRSTIGRHLEESPSLRPLVMPLAEKVYPAAARRAADETGLAIGGFPTFNPYTRDQMLDMDFLP